VKDPDKAIPSKPTMSGEATLPHHSDRPTGHATQRERIADNDDAKKREAKIF
jgi:hypothetical protein